jgi:acetolactate decarboxylase
MGELKQKGDFGIGTLDHLDGEMVALDGIVYQARGDGKVIEVPDSTTTPFASMTKFSADTTTEGMSAKSYDELKETIDAGLPSENLFYAVKVTGNFPVMKVRSVTRQEPPYRPLTEVVNDQKLFDFAGTSGTLIGFRCPEYVQGVNVAGYHLHYLSADKSQGGHVLDFELAEGRVEVDRLSNFSMMLPQSEHFLDMDLSEKNEEAIHKVEKLSVGSEKK